MPRNRDIWLLILGQAILQAAAIRLFPSPLPVCVLSLSIGLGLFFTLRRERSIARLSGYLQKLTRGEKSLDIRDNREGGLSILKNELYKISVAFEEQSGLLAREKREMAKALADISHQLKTPLTALFVITDLLEDDNLPPERRREFIRNMRFSLERMEWLALTLLKLARLDADAVVFNPSPLWLSDLAERALRPLLIPLELSEQTVLTEGRDGTFTCDPEWTSEALSNIIKNASRATPPGGVIRISYGINPLYAFMAVRDGGKGVDKADMPHLFTRFYRGANTRQDDGAGIGLSLSLAVMRKQGGDIEVFNEGGGDGAVFTLKFYQTDPPSSLTEPAGE